MIRRRMMFGIESGGGNDENCVSLFHFDSNLTDAAGSVTLSAEGTYFAGYSTTSKKFGTAAFLGREVGQYGSLYLENSTAWQNALTNDYTIDFWVRVESRMDLYDLMLCGNFGYHWLLIRCTEDELRITHDPNSFNQAIPFAFD